jgi:hypothetical protein
MSIDTPLLLPSDDRRNDDASTRLRGATRRVRRAVLARWCGGYGWTRTTDLGIMSATL